MPGDLRIIIAGGGEVGLRTAQLLVDRGHNVILIEEDEERCQMLSDQYVATIIDGDATRPSILRQAAPERSDALAALTDDEAANFAVCMAAKQMASIRTVMRTNTDPDPAYTEYVDGLVFPEYHGARVAANEITGIGVRTLEEVTGDLEIIEVEVASGAPAVGKALESVRLPRGSLIISDARGQIGGPQMVLEEGRRYIVAVESTVADEVMNLLRG